MQQMMNAVVNTPLAADTFFREYTSSDAILKYARASAGFGISYLLDHEYKSVYLEALDRLPRQIRQDGIRILEFGCGCGMNLLHLVSVLGRHGIRVEQAIGTDFSPVLIDAAKREATRYLADEDRRKVQFCVARNETLIDELAAATGVAEADLVNSFHFVIGVNTIRYCHRANTEAECARDIFRLLMPGGVCVVIDMNDRFPAFRSALKDKLRGNKRPQQECYLPSLEEYTAPFTRADFRVLRTGRFCWIPHSAGRFLTGLCRTLSPVLTSLDGSRAMRSLVIAQKPSV
jgi:SAM-dependent methyltransferase